MCRRACMRRVDVRRSAGARARRRPVRPQTEAVGDGDAAVGPVGEVPRVEVELDQGRLVSLLLPRPRLERAARRPPLLDNRARLAYKNLAADHVPNTVSREQHGGTSFEERRNDATSRALVRWRLLGFHVHLGLVLAPRRRLAAMDLLSVHPSHPRRLLVRCSEPDRT